jgi:hypothetical protein
MGEKEGVMANHLTIGVKVLDRLSNYIGSHEKVAAGSELDENTYYDIGRNIDKSLRARILVLIGIIWEDPGHDYFVSKAKEVIAAHNQLLIREIAPQNIGWIEETVTQEFARIFSPQNGKKTPRDRALLNAVLGEEYASGSKLLTEEGEAEVLKREEKLAVLLSWRNTDHWMHSITTQQDSGLLRRTEETIAMLGDQTNPKEVHEVFKETALDEGEFELWHRLNHLYADTGDSDPTRFAATVKTVISMHKAEDRLTPESAYIAVSHAIHDPVEAPVVVDAPAEKKGPVTVSAVDRQTNWDQSLIQELSKVKGIDQNAVREIVPLVLSTLLRGRPELFSAGNEDAKSGLFRVIRDALKTTKKHQSDSAHIAEGCYQYIEAQIRKEGQSVDALLASLKIKKRLQNNLKIVNHIRKAERAASSASAASEKGSRSARMLKRMTTDPTGLIQEVLQPSMKQLFPTEELQDQFADHLETGFGNLKDVLKNDPVLAQEIAETITTKINKSLGKGGTKEETTRDVKAELTKAAGVIDLLSRPTGGKEAARTLKEAVHAERSIEPTEDQQLLIDGADKFYAKMVSMRAERTNKDNPDRIKELKKLHTALSRSRKLLGISTSTLRMGTKFLPFIKKIAFSMIWLFIENPKLEKKAKLVDDAFVEAVSMLATQLLTYHDTKNYLPLMKLAERTLDPEKDLPSETETKEVFLATMEQFFAEVEVEPTKSCYVNFLDEATIAGLALVAGK